VTNGAEADLAIFFAVTDPDNPRRRLSAFLVETDSPGLTIGKHEDKLGIRASSTVELVCDDLVISPDRMLGPRGEGIKVALGAITGGRLGIASQALGIAEASLRAAARYAKERTTFGRPIADYQAIQWKLADMAVEIAASRALIRRAAWLKQAKKPYAAEAAMAKTVASESASRCANRAIQTLGGYGYIRDYPVERYLRDAKITELYEGTSEIQRITVARDLLKSS
jgi:butyryl-CoA dehydrogenase